MQNSYKQAAKQVEVIYEIKKSEFIAWAGPAESREQAMQLLAKAKEAFPDARHHCWAYLIGDPKNAVTMACADDGEPTGTAGRPMLNILQHKDVGDVMVVISRYFGGTKLGAGGLVRAYSQATQQVIAIMQTDNKIPMVELLVSLPFSLDAKLRHAVKQQGGKIEDLQYQEGIGARVSIPEENSRDFCSLFEALSDVTIKSQADEI